MTKIGDIAAKMEAFAPLHLQESYDNSGLMIGHKETEVKGVLLTIDVTEEVLKEAKEKGCNLVISHHPLIFGGIKKITGQNLVQRCVEYAIKNDIAIYAAHTNFDKAATGVSYKIAEKLGLQHIEVLEPEKEKVFKIVTFVPTAQTEQVAQAMYQAGAGTIGAYDNCSYRSTGEGTFRASDGCNPFCGEIGEYHKEPEERLEVIVPAANKSKVIAALIKAHPYEEPAYDVFETEIDYAPNGLGCIGDLAEATDAKQVLQKIKDTFGGMIRYTQLPEKPIKRIALCGGAGHEFLGDAIKAGAELYLTADVKYHEFFDADNKIVLADIGHFESEQFTKEIFYDVIYEKNSNFALIYSENKTNPIKYL